MVAEHLVKLTIQAGTEIGTNWGYFYDVEQDVFSQIFQCIYTQSSELIAYGTSGKLIVQDIFDVSKYYQEISAFQYSFSLMVDPIIDVVFAEDEKSITVSYWTGSDYQKVTEVIDLP